VDGLTDTEADFLTVCPEEVESDFEALLLVVADAAVALILLDHILRDVTIRYRYNACCGHTLMFKGTGPMRCVDFQPRW
jgi:hypothetical protein